MFIKIFPHIFFFKDVRGCQFLTVEATETFCMVFVPPEKHIFRKKYRGNRPSKSHILKVFDHQICILQIF